MATSGTVGLTQLNVADVIADATRKCRVPSTAQTPELVEVAKNNLFYYLSSLVNRGQLLWAIEPTIVGLLPGQAIYPLERGTVDVLANNTSYVTTSLIAGTAATSAGGTAANAFDQDITTACTQTSADGNISLQATTTSYLTMVGIMSLVERDYTLEWEWSDDGITYTSLLSVDEQTYPARKWVYFYVTNPRSADFFRVRETGGATLSVIEIAMVNFITATPIPVISRDQYTNLPNPNFLQRQVNQYYFRRTRENPSIYTWPVPTNFMDLLTLQRSRQIQDVGELTNDLEIPQRWSEAATWQLAARMCPDLQSLPGLPRVDGEYLSYLQRMAEKFEREAFDEERDDGPTYFTPQVGVYTA